MTPVSSIVELTISNVLISHQFSAKDVSCLYSELLKQSTPLMEIEEKQE
jgi:hypothetical protein